MNCRALVQLLAVVILAAFAAGCSAEEEGAAGGDSLGAVSNLAESAPTRSEIVDPATAPIPRAGGSEAATDAPQAERVTGFAADRAALAAAKDSAEAAEGIPSAEGSLSAEGSPPAADSFPAHVDTTAINVRSGPGTGNPIVTELVRGESVRVLETRKVGGTTWWRVEAVSGAAAGWVAAGLMARGEGGPREIADIDYGDKRTPTLAKPATYHGAPIQYVGVSVCQDCHEDAHRENGTQLPAFEVWSGQLHASAYQSLSRSYTQRIAEKLRGIDDPAKDWRCLKCHVTAFGAAPEQKAPTYTDSDGVGCEVCHGPGSAYAEHAEGDHPSAHGDTDAERKALGFNKLSDLAERETVCRSCHNERSPTYKPFDLQKFSAVIRHWEDPGFVPAPREPRPAPALPVEPRKETQEAPTPPPAPVKPPVEEIAPLPLQEAPKPAPAPPAPPTPPSPAKEVAPPPPAPVTPPSPPPRPAPSGSSPDPKWSRNEGMTNFDPDLGVLVLNRPVADPSQFKVDPELGATKGTVEFDHQAHAASDLISGAEVTCQTCHHRDRPGEKPRRCFTCHKQNDGNPNDDLPNETKAKSRSTHSKHKKHGFPKTQEWADVENTSCYGCHTTQNAVNDAGAPVKCKQCHEG